MTIQDTLSCYACIPHDKSFLGIKMFKRHKIEKGKIQTKTKINVKSPCLAPPRVEFNRTFIDETLTATVVSQ